MTRRFLGVLFLVLLIGLAAPGRSLAGSEPDAAAKRANLAQMEPSAQTVERPIELERQRMRSRFRYLMLGYGLIWVSLGAYLIQMNRHVARVGNEIDELKGRLDDLQVSGRRTER